MPKTTINLDVVCDPDWDANTRLNAYSDFGTGFIDYTRPLLGRGVRAFPETAPVRRLGEGRLGEVNLGGARTRTKRVLAATATALGAIGLSGSLEVIALAVEVPPAFSRHRFAVKAFDEGGVEQSAPIEAEAFVSSTDPEPPAFRLLRYSPAADKFEFALF